MNDTTKKVIGDILFVVFVTTVVYVPAGLAFGFDAVSAPAIFIGACIGRAISIAISVATARFDKE